jgi:hypothetical protein
MAEDAINTGLDIAEKAIADKEAAQRSKLLTQNPAGAEYAARQSKGAQIIKDAINKHVPGMEDLEAEFAGEEIIEDE